MGVKKGEEMTSKDTSIGVAFGFFVGTAIGLAIGFLYAPRPGAETRKLIREKTEEAKAKSTGVIDKVQESVAKAKYRRKWAEQQN